MNIIDELKLKLTDAYNLAEFASEDQYNISYYKGQCAGLRIALQLLGCTDKEIAKALHMNPNATTKEKTEWSITTTNLPKNKTCQIKELIQEMRTETNDPIKISDIVAAATPIGINETETIEAISKMRRGGDLMKPTHDSVKLV